MGRVFMMVYQPCYGETGGGHGIEYRIYRANEKESIIDNIYYVFSDRVVKNGSKIGRLAIKNSTSKTSSSLKNAVNKIKPGFLRALKIQNDYNSICNYIRNLDKEYHFSNEDIFIFHDVKMAYAFTKLFNYKRTALVFHMQGSVYNEWRAFSGISSSSVQKVLNRIFVQSCHKIRYLCFPSNGALESLIESAPELKDEVLKCDIKILYNGVNCPCIDLVELPDEVKSIEESNNLKFITVAALNSAKAVERIPQYLGKLKKAGKRITWILVGNGIMATEVEKRIIQNDLVNNTLWIKNFVSHDQVLKMMSKSDFYILFHKQSIFDLSTLEAMHYGCIPVLTPVGGNNEMIVDNNGFFVDDFSDIEELNAAIESGSISNLKDKNCTIQSKMFCEKAMLDRYKELCTELLSIN